MAINVDQGIKNLREIAVLLNSLANAMETREVQGFTGDLSVEVANSTANAEDVLSFTGAVKSRIEHTDIQVFGDLTVKLGQPHEK